MLYENYIEAMPASITPALIEDAREMRLSGASFSNILLWSIKHTNHPRELMNAAFGIRYGATSIVNYWHNFDSGSYTDAEIDTSLENALVFTEFSALHLVPQEVRILLEAHKEWLISYGKQGRRLVTSEAPSLWKRLNLSGYNLREANLSDTVFDHCDFSRCNMMHVAMQRTQLLHINFHQTNLSFSVLEDTNLDFCSLVHSNLNNFSLSAASVRFMNLASCSCLHAKVNNCQLTMCWVTNSDFSGCEATNLKILQSAITQSKFAFAQIELSNFVETETKEITGLDTATITNVSQPEK